MQGVLVNLDADGVVHAGAGGSSERLAGGWHLRCFEAGWPCVALSASAGLFARAGCYQLHRASSARESAFRDRYQFHAIYARLRGNVGWKDFAVAGRAISFVHGRALFSVAQASPELSNLTIWWSCTVSTMRRVMAKAVAFVAYEAAMGRFGIRATGVQAIQAVKLASIRRI